MSFVAVAVGGSALVGGIMGASAAGNAADKQAEASKYAADIQHRMFEEQRNDQQPWREAGTQALSGLANPDFQKDFNLSDFNKDPGYDFRMQEGQKALERSAAARGGLGGGATLKALSRYGQDYASNEYNNAYNRFNGDRDRRFNRLSSIAGLGQTANAQMGAAGQNYANSMGSIMTSNANAQGAAGIAQSNAISGALNSGIGNWMNMQMLNKIGAK